MKAGDGNYVRKSAMLQAVIIACEGVIRYAARYAKLAQEEAAKETDPARRAELRHGLVQERRQPLHSPAIREHAVGIGQPYAPDATANIFHTHVPPVRRSELHRRIGADANGGDRRDQ